MAEYVTRMNAFLPTLVNVIAFAEVYTKAFENPIARFKKGNIPLGYTGEFIHVNPAELEDYTRPKAPAHTDPFAGNDPVVFADYLTIDEDKIASTTLSEDYLSDAFSSLEKVYEMGQAIVSSLYSGNAIYELNLMLKTIAKGFGAGIREPQTMVMPTDLKTTLDATLQIKDFSSFLKQPTSKYVSAAFPTAITFTEQSNQILLLKSTLRNRLSTYSTAWAVNEGKLEFVPETVELVDIGQIAGAEILAVVMDVAALQIRDKIFRVNSIYNPADGTLTYWLRRRTMSGFVGFANAVAFVEETAPATQTASTKASK